MSVVRHAFPKYGSSVRLCSIGDLYVCGIIRTLLICLLLSWT
jgi:hypothetical protein